MKTVETIATISPTGDIKLSRLEDLPVGRFKVVLVIDESSLITEETTEFNASKGSFLEVAGDVIVSLEGLPSDLSVNKKYFEGFGE